jgi:hypothetical protein
MMMSRRNDAFERGLLLLIVVVGVLLVGMAFASFPFGAYAFFSNQLNGTAATATFRQLYVFAAGILLPFSVPSGVFSVGATFFFVWAVYLSFLVLLVKGPWYSMVKAVRNIMADGTLAIYSSGALTWSVAFPATLLLAVYIDMLLTAVGVPIGSISTADARYAFWSISYAPLIEEVGFRVTIIGLVTLLIAYRWGGGWKSLRALWHPSRTLGALKIESWRHPGIYAAIVGSAAIFGVQHVLGGWDVGKFFSSLVVGLAFGLIYFTHGLPAAVMMHWGFNYFEYSLFYFDQVRGLPALMSEFGSLSSLQYSQFYGDLFVFMMGFAVLSLALYMVGKAVMARRHAKAHPPEVPLPANPAPSP